MTDFFLVETDENCIVRRYDGHGKMMAEERIEGLPQIVSSSDGFLIEPNRWLMKRFVDDDLAPGSVRNEAVAVRAFFQYLDILNRDWMTVDDGVLRAWRNSLRLRRHLTSRRRARGAQAHRAKPHPASNEHVNSYLNAVFKFYVWCEETGRIEGVVNFNEFGRSASGMISSENVSILKRNGDRVTVRRCPLLLHKSSARPRRTPSDKDIGTLHQQLTGKHAERNALILLVAEETGARRNDILQLRVDSMPDIEAILSATRDDRLLPLLVMGKRRIERQINLKPGTALLIRQWIDMDRQEIVDRASNRSLAYEEPKQVFLSDRGAPINPNWVSNLVTKLFHSAGIERASLHRLRAAFLTRLADGFVKYRDSQGDPLPLATIHFYFQEIAGWTSLASLERYVTAAYRRSVTNDSDIPNVAISDEQLAAILSSRD